MKKVLMLGMLLLLMMNAYGQEKTMEFKEVILLLSSKNELDTVVFTNIKINTIPRFSNSWKTGDINLTKEDSLKLKFDPLKNINILPYVIFKDCHFDVLHLDALNFRNEVNISFSKGNIEQLYINSSVFKSIKINFNYKFVDTINVISIWDSSFENINISIANEIVSEVFSVANCKIQKSVFFDVKFNKSSYFQQYFLFNNNNIDINSFDLPLDKWDKMIDSSLVDKGFIFNNEKTNSYINILGDNLEVEFKNNIFSNNIGSGNIIFKFHVASLVFSKNTLNSNINPLCGLNIQSMFEMIDRFSRGKVYEL